MPHYCSTWIAAVGLLALSFSCGPQQQDNGYGLPCEGKCDYLDNPLVIVSKKFKNLVKDISQVDVSDLVNLSAKMITGQINDQLENIPYTDIQMSPTEIYATAEEAKTFEHNPLKDMNVHDIDALRSGLFERYGDQSFVTTIIEQRANFLKSNPHYVYTESKFKFGGTIDPSVSFEALSNTGSIGLSVGAGIETTVIAPYDTHEMMDRIKTLAVSPLQAIKQSRGFILPTTMDDLRRMAPGETIGLKTNGVIALNVGMGLPIYLTTIADTVTLHAVISAGATVTLGGKLVDIQIIREKDQNQGLDNVIVDVGMMEPQIKHFGVAVKTQWGVEGLADIIGENKLEVGPLTLDATKFVEQSLEQLLNRKLSLGRAAYTVTKESYRHNITRFHFDLSRVCSGGRDEKCADPNQEQLRQAIVQAIYGDLRLAQNLAYKAEAGLDTGVTMPVALMRSADKFTNYFGAEFLGLKFYREKMDQQGAIVISEGAKSQEILFNELDEKSGFWCTDHGIKRRAISALTSVGGIPVDADANLQVKVWEADSFMKRDQILDHVDPLLAFFIGYHNLMNRIAPITNPLEQYVNDLCPVNHLSSNQEGYQEAETKYINCVANLSQDPHVVSSVKAAQAVFKTILAEKFRGEMNPQLDDARAFAQKLFDLKLAVQSSYQFPTFKWLPGLTFEGPESDLLADFRLPDSAMRNLFTDNRDAFPTALKQVLTMTYQYRRDDYADQVKDVKKKIDGLRDEINDLVRLRDVYSAEYNLWDNVGQIPNLINLEGKSEIMGNQAQLAFIGTKGEVLDMLTVAERKAEVFQLFFDALLEKYDAGDTAGQVIGYTLLNSTTPSNVELLVNMSFEKTHDTNHPSLNLHGIGQQAKVINAGEYNLNDLFSK